MTTPDTDNIFGIGLRGENIVFLMPMPQTLSKSNALLLAAYIVAIADNETTHYSFDDYLSALTDKACSETRPNIPSKVK